MREGKGVAFSVSPGNSETRAARKEFSSPIMVILFNLKPGSERNKRADFEIYTLLGVLRIGFLHVCVEKCAGLKVTKDVDSPVCYPMPGL